VSRIRRTKIMTVNELITRLQAIENKDAEVILEDGILGLAVKLTSVSEKSIWQDGAINLVGTALPNSS
jgi:hypothetical protein